MKSYSPYADVIRAASHDERYREMIARQIMDDAKTESKTQNEYQKVFKSGEFREDTCVMAIDLASGRSAVFSQSEIRGAYGSYGGTCFTVSDLDKAKEIAERTSIDAFFPFAIRAAYSSYEEAYTEKRRVGRVTRFFKEAKRRVELALKCLVGRDIT